MGRRGFKAILGLKKLLPGEGAALPCLLEQQGQRVDRFSLHGRRVCEATFDPKKFNGDKGVVRRFFLLL
jgi:hypothetical protein